MQNNHSIFSLDINRLTEGEKAAIGQLRKLVNDELTDKFMEEDYYLAKWLYETDFKMEAALKLLREHLNWRKEENIGNILEENWGDLNIRFPYSRSTKDKSGKPLLYFDLGQWNISKLLADDPSSVERLGRYIVKLHVESEAHVRQLRAEGQDITQFNLLINLEGYSIRKHASIRCFHFYRRMGEILTPHFPRCVEKVVFVNVPPIFKLAYYFLSSENQKCINIFGRDRGAWEPVLLEYIDRDQIPGGLLDDN